MIVKENKLCDGGGGNGEGLTTDVPIKEEIQKGDYGVKVTLTVTSG